MSEKVYPDCQETVEECEAEYCEDCLGNQVIDLESKVSALDRDNKRYREALGDIRNALIFGNRPEDEGLIEIIDKALKGEE